MIVVRITEYLFKKILIYLAKNAKNLSEGCKALPYSKGGMYEVKITKIQAKNIKKGNFIDENTRKDMFLMKRYLKKCIFSKNFIHDFG